MGRGIDLDAIRAYLKDKIGMSHEEMGELPSEELLSIICRTDFSSAGETTQLAGRGIGMNVIVQAIGYLGGAIKVHSEPLKGTQFIITLPLSLSIIYAVLFRLGKYTLAIPTSHVEAIEKGGADSPDKDGGFCDLRSLLRMDADADGAGKGQIIRLRPPATTDMLFSQKGGLGIAAEEIIGNMPLMAIPLGEFLAKTRLFAGVGIMENGDISLILDLEKIQAAAA